MKVIDKFLRRVGLMRISQVPLIDITSDGHIKVEWKNGFRWSGQQDKHFLTKVST